MRTGRRGGADRRGARRPLPDRRGDRARLGVRDAPRTPATRTRVTRARGTVDAAAVDALARAPPGAPVEEQGRVRVESGDALHVVVGEREVEDVEVLAHPLGADGLRAVEDSLRRLGTDGIDLYQVHRPDPAVDVEETLGALSASSSRAG